MNHFMPVSVVERRCYLRRDTNRFLDWQLPLPIEPCAKRFARDVRHDVKEASVSFSRVEQLKEIGMLEVGGDPDFAQETLAAENGRQLRLEDLQRNGAMMPEITGEIHCRHSAGADLALDLVSFGDRALQRVLPLHLAPIVGERLRYDGAREAASIDRIDRITVNPRLALTRDDTVSRCCPSPAGSAAHNRD